MESIIQIGEKECYICGSVSGLEQHHAFGGVNRKASEKYGLKIWLCQEHHRGEGGVHFYQPLMDMIHRIAQLKFEEIYNHEKFVEIFGKNYLEYGEAKP